MIGDPYLPSPTEVQKKNDRRRATCKHEHIIALCADCAIHFEPRAKLDGYPKWKAFSAKVLQAVEKFTRSKKKYTF